MKEIKTLRNGLLLAILAVTSVGFSLPSFAASDDECAIWMCLPTGFPSGCGGAKRAFKDRIKHFKSALPSFSSCVKDSGNSGSSDTFTAKDGLAAFIPSYEYCAQRESKDHQCILYKKTEPEYRKGTQCRYNNKDNTRSPAHCTRTFRYSEVYRNGVQYGQTHYY